MHRHYRRAEGGRRPGGYYENADNRELTQNEVDQVRRVKNKIYYHFIVTITVAKGRVARIKVGPPMKNGNRKKVVDISIVTLTDWA